MFRWRYYIFWYSVIAVIFYLKVSVSELKDHNAWPPVCEMMRGQRRSNSVPNYHNVFAETHLEKN
jgi:hypothetical protein